MSIQQSSYYPVPVISGTTAGTYAEGNAPRIIDVSHAELLSLMGAQNLKRGFHYRITDFVTEYISNDSEWISPSNTANVSNNSGTAFTVSSIAATPEPLIVYAITSNSVSREAYSESYPQDIIHYDPTLTVLDGTNTAKGFIIYRKDTVNNNETDYDFRNVRFKRWFFDPSIGTRSIPALQNATSYSVGDMVVSPAEGVIGAAGILFICAIDHTTTSANPNPNFISLGQYTTGTLNNIILHEMGLFEAGARKTQESFDLFGGASQAGYYSTFCNANGLPNSTNRFKNISIKSSKPAVQNPAYSTTLPNIVLRLASNSTNYFRNINISESSFITLFGIGQKTNINIKKSQFIYLSFTVSNATIDDCRYSIFSGILNKVEFSICERIVCPTVSGLNLLKSERVTVGLDQNNPRSVECNNVSMVGFGSHVKLGLTSRVPVVTNTTLRASPLGYAPRADITFTTGATNLPVAKYIGQNNTEVVVPFYSDNQLVFRHANDQLISVIDGIADPSASLPLFSVQDHSTPSYTRNTSSWLNSYKAQLACVSPWNSVHANLRSGVAITKRHIQFARHFPLQAGATIRFVTADNQVVDRTISRTLLQTGASSNDIGIGLLNSDLPSSIAPAKVWLAGARIYLPTQSGNTLINGIRMWLPQTGVFYVDQDKKAPIVDWAVCGFGQFGLFRPLENNAFYDSIVDENKHEFFEPIITNDSGGPTFAIINGECILLGCLYAGSTSPNEGQYCGTAVGETGDVVLNALIASIDAAEGISTGYTATAPNLSGFSEVS